MKNFFCLALVAAFMLSCTVGCEGDKKPVVKDTVKDKVTTDAKDKKDK